MTSPSESFFRLENVSVSYGRYEAVRNLDFEISRGEVVGLLGDNGAGKSTTIKLMSGTERITSGAIYLDGKEVALRSRRDSENCGIETIYQEAALIDQLSIVRNLFLSREIANPIGLLKLGEMRRISREILTNAVSISGIRDPDQEVGTLSGGQKQSVAIARAVYFKRRLLLLDEPTSALSVRETDALLDYVRRLRDEGVASVLVTHNLYHAFEVCDRFVVLSHGRKVLEVDKKDTTLRELTDHVIKM
ncbi:ATP-binding cassette domain-containing protein [Mesorhizobium sp. KR9-304]|uniref:ATP-binding cassette domain-containing protein n=1 Tax=Mesorhizobium sp. KR9-304 TaxID=3156614 RepID=UPI0032B3A50D